MPVIRIRVVAPILVRSHSRFTGHAEKPPVPLPVRGHYLFTDVAEESPAPLPVPSDSLFADLGEELPALLPIATPPRRWPVFVVSLALHGVAFFFAPVVLDRLAAWSEADAWIRQAKLGASRRIQMPERLYLATSAPREPEPRKLSGQAKRDLRNPARIRSKKRAARAPRRDKGSSRRQFELAALAGRPKGDTTLLQPSSPQELPLELKLTDVFLWAPEVAKALEPKPVVTPGVPLAATSRPPLNTPALLARPNLETALDSRSVASSPRGSQSSFFAPSLAFPIRVSTAPAPPPPAPVSTERAPGDAIALLAITPRPMPLLMSLLVPPGSLISENLSPQAESGDLTAQGRTADQAMPVNQSSGRPENAPAGGGAEEAKARAASVAERVERTLAETRITHPLHGAHDVIIQAATVEGFPESAGALSGKPVFTVYLSVGARKDWILQYCAPGGPSSPAQREDDMLVRLEKAPRVAPPYPRTTFRPPFSGRRGSFLVVHGFIEKDGRFRELRVLSPAADDDQRVVTLVLERWEFRPAISEGKPLRVEALLAIPAE